MKNGEDGSDTYVSNNKDECFRLVKTMEYKYYHIMVTLNGNSCNIN